MSREQKIEKLRSKKARAKAIEEAIKLTYSSLESHLPYVYEKTPEGTKWHADCVKEYARTITLLASLY